MTFREAAWKLADVCAYARPGQLTMAVSAELKALMKLAGKAHPQLQAMLVDLHLYRPRLVAATTKLSPPELHMENPATWPDEDDELEEAAHAAQQALTTAT